MSKAIWSIKTESTTIYQELAPENFIASGTNFKVIKLFGIPIWQKTVDEVAELPEEEDTAAKKSGGIGFGNK